MKSNQTNGTHLEAGANDGESFSNSLYLEREYGWTGILVEAVPELYKKLLTKNRRAYSLEGYMKPNQTLTGLLT
jgi:hypothetical protein